MIKGIKRYLEKKNEPITNSNSKFDTFLDSSDTNKVNETKGRNDL